MIAWFRRKKNIEDAPHGWLSERAREEICGRLGAEQRVLMERVEGCTRVLQKRCFVIAAMVRDWKGEQGALLTIQAEQESLRRGLMRWEIVQMDTADLLKEWRDWMREERKRASGMKKEERREMVRSELEVRGVIGENERGIEYRELKKQAIGEGSFEEWDQYIGDRLPSSVAFWEMSVEEALKNGDHSAIVHGLVRQMKRAHGQAKIWRKMRMGF